MILTDLFESQEIHNQQHLDSILERCLELLHDKRRANPDKYGKVAACIIDHKNRKVFGINSPGPNGTRRHAERVAIDKYHERYGKILPGAIIVTTLSPCNRDMAERDGPSCQDLLQQVGIEKVYAGYMDPSQHSDHPFTEEVTKNDDIWAACKALSDSFVHDDLCESVDDQGAAGIILYAADTGRYGLQQRSDSINDPGVWAAWGGGREPGESLEQCATRELGEEGGYHGPIKLKRLAENAKYVTFIGVVPHEFEPEPCNEWKDYCWVEAGDWPSPMHPGVAAALDNVYIKEDKITLSTDPNWYGAEVGDYRASGPVVIIPANQLVGFEPDDKMNQPKSRANVEKIVAGLKQGNKLPPLLVRKYKNGYQVLDGHHRFWAYKLLGVKSIPAQIVPDSDIEEKGQQGVAENFADGKVRGKSRPGRVKRAGASCDGSVTDLRAKAKKYGGEKGKMYHWCANMKSGKNK